jgi:hypothetical protein
MSKAIRDDDRRHAPRRVERTSARPSHPRSRTEIGEHVHHHAHLPEDGRDRRAAVPRGDGAARSVFGRPRQKIRLACIEMVHGAAGDAVFGIKKNMWSPAAVATASLPPTSRAPLGRCAVRHDRDQHRRAHAERSRRPRRDHRSSAVFLTQTHPQQTQGSTSRRRLLDQMYLQVRAGHSDPVDTAARERR